MFKPGDKVVYVGNKYDYVLSKNCTYKIYSIHSEYCILDDILGYNPVTLNYTAFLLSELRLAIKIEKKEKLKKLIDE